MTTLIIDEQTSHTPIGEILQSVSDERIEMRNTSGDLLATLIVATDDRDEDERYEELRLLLERDREIIARRQKTPLDQCLTTTEFVERLQQLDGNG